MSLTINGATNTVTAASGLTVAGNTAVTGTLSVSAATASLSLSSTGATNPAITLTESGGRTAIFSGPTSPGIDYARIGTTSNHDVAFLYGNAEKMRLTSTGLAVTGTLSATSTVTGAAGSTGTSVLVGNWTAVITGTETFEMSLQANSSTRKVGLRHKFNGGANANDLALFTSYADVVSERLVITASDGSVTLNSTTDATSTTAASLKTAGGLGVAKKLYVGDNIVMASGKGIDFSATADGGGTTTSEVLSDYEEGTWTPTQGAGLTVSGAFNSSGTYTKVGRKVTVIGIVSGATSVAASSGGAMVGGLPFTAASYCEGTATNAAATAGSVLFIDAGASIYSVSAIAATASIRFAATYFV